MSTQVGHRRLLVGLLGASGLLYLLLLDLSASWDDSLVYLVGARALAEGKGYVLLNFPPPHPEIRMYPPLLSGLLSLLWRLAPEYPGNLPLMKSVGLLSALAFAWGSARLLAEDGRVPALVLGAVGLFLVHPMTTQMVGATVLSDLPFAAATVWALVFAERSARASGHGLGHALGAGFLVAVAFLLRAAGVIPWILVTGWLFLRRRWAAGWVVAVAGALAALFFIADATSPRPAPERLWFYGGQTSYADAFRYVPTEDGSLRQRSAVELARLVLRQELQSAAYLMTDALALGRIGLPFELARQKAPSGASGLLLSVAGIFVGVLVFVGLVGDWRARGPLLPLFCGSTFAVSALWPGGVTFLSRYLLPAGVLLSYYFLLGFSRIGPEGGRWSSRTSRGLAVALLLMLPGAAFAVRHAWHRHAPGGPIGTYYATQAEQAAAFAWIDQYIPDPEPVAAHSAVQLFLMTDHPAVPFVRETLASLAQRGVGWILIGPEDFEDHRASLENLGWRSVWKSRTETYEVYRATGDRS